MRCTLAFVAGLGLAVSATTARADSLTIVAASDLKFAMAELVEQYRLQHPGDDIRVIYGSSGKFATQIRNGAPFDMYFSADVEYPRMLEADGLTASPTRLYARGRIVVWTRGPAPLTIGDLRDESVRRIAIANHRHAPYGVRAMEALQSVGLWEHLQPRLVYGENIAHAAQFVKSGAAEAGIVALALVKSPQLAKQGHWTLVPAELHMPLDQGYVTLKRAAGNAVAARFDAYVAGPAARAVLDRYGFELPQAGD